jgi:hypothetical protein
LVTYASAASAALVALILALALLVAPLRARLRGKRRRAQEVVEALSPERRARIDQFVR